MMHARLACFAAVLAVLGAPEALAKRNHDDKKSSPASAPKAASPHGSSGPLDLPPKGTGKCVVTQHIDNAFSKLHVDGELNNHGIELDKKETARPEGNIQVTLNIPCPADAADLAEPFAFAMESPSPLLIMPQEDLTIKAAKIVTVEVDKLQIMLRTPTPIEVDSAEFKKEVGLTMTVVSGTATAMKQSFELTGFETTVPFNGYFDLLSTGEMVLHFTNFNAKFLVKVDDPAIDGYFTVTGFISAFGDLPNSLQQELAAHVTHRALRALGARAAVLGMVALVALAVVGALRRRQAALAATEPLEGVEGAAAGQSDSVAVDVSAGSAPSESLQHVSSAQQ